MSLHIWQLFSKVSLIITEQVRFHAEFLIVVTDAGGKKTKRDSCIYTQGEALSFIPTHFCFFTFQPSLSSFA